MLCVQCTCRFWLFPVSAQCLVFSVCLNSLLTIWRFSHLAHNLFIAAFKYDARFVFTVVLLLQSSLRDKIDAVDETDVEIRKCTHRRWLDSLFLNRRSRMHQDMEVTLTSQISTTEITDPGEHDYQSASSKLSNIRDISVTRKSYVEKSPVSTYCVWYLFFVSISMSVLYVFQKNEFSQRYSFDFDSVLLYLLETRRVQIVVILRLTTWSTRFNICSSRGPKSRLQTTCPEPYILRNSKLSRSATVYDIMFTFDIWR